MLEGPCVSGVRKKMMGQGCRHFVEGRGLECKNNILAASVGTIGLIGHSLIWSSSCYCYRATSRTVLIT
jgi:hypothetical protein